MNTTSLLLELYGRISPLARKCVSAVPTERLTESPAPGANSIGWLLWHAARVQDHHISELLDTPQIWMTQPWPARFGLEPEPDNTGYGHSAAEMAQVQPEGTDALLGYLDEVDARTRSMLESLAPTDLDRIVDRRWDPPVTMGVRLVSIADDSLQHLGQAAYVRGLFGY